MIRMAPRRQTTSRRLGAALATAALIAGPAVALSGCGAANVVDPVAQAATSSNAAPGYRLRLTAQISSPALPTPLAMTGTGAFDARDHIGSAAVTMNLGNSPQVVKALGTSTLHIQELIDKQIIYVKLPPALAAKVPGAKPWLKINLAAALAARGMPGLGSLQNGPMSSDPSQMLQYLRATSGHLTKVGSDTVDGFATTHYKATIQLDRVAKLAPAAQRAAVRQSIAALEKQTNVHQLPVDVWIDGGHLVRRIRLSYAMNVATGQTMNMLMTVDIPQYGPQPLPTFPPASQTTDLSSQLGSAQSAGA
jgi:hypothetical protein